MKKAAVVFLALALLMMIFAVPVMAKTSKKITVTFTRTGSFLTTGNHWYSEDGAYHLRDTTIGFHTYAIAGQDVSYAGSSEGTMWGNLHNVQETTTPSGAKAMVGEGGMTSASEIFFADGNFEGIIQSKGMFVIYPETLPAYARGYASLVNGEFRGVWHGTGIYTGQTLMLDYEVVNAVVPTPLTGTLLIP